MKAYTSTVNNTIHDGEEEGEELPGGEQVMVLARQTKVVINRSNKTQKPKLFMMPTSQQTNKLYLFSCIYIQTLTAQKLLLYTTPRSLQKVEFVKIFEIIY